MTHENGLQKLAELLETRGLRKHLNINNCGYSQIERDIVSIFISTEKMKPTRITLTKDNLQETMEFINEFCKKNSITNSILKWNRRNQSNVCIFHCSDKFCFIPDWMEDSPRLNLKFNHLDYGSAFYPGDILVFYKRWFKVIKLESILVKYKKPVEYFFGEKCPIKIK